MRRFILTGAPGAGKTAIVRELEARGFPVVEEAATDVIAREQAAGIDAPWLEARFIAEIAQLQEFRRKTALAGPVQFHDRSVFCTLALARFLGHPVPDVLETALNETRAAFEPQVFFTKLMGFIVMTDARRIDLAEAQRFEAVHEAAYREYGFTLVPVEPAPIAARVAAILTQL
jgi:predicted ATPase